MIYNLGIRLFKNKEDAMDFSQDVYMVAYSKLETFEGRSKISTWLYSLALNLGLKKIKKQKRLKVDFSDNEELLEKQAAESGPEGTGKDPFDGVSRAEINNQVQAELETLPEEYRLPLILLYYEKLSYSEISGQLGIKEGTLKSYIHRGKRILSEKLKLLGLDK